MHQRQAFALNLFYHHAQYRLLLVLVFGEEHQSRAVFSFLWHGNALQQNKLVRNLQHNSRTVARLVARLGTTMFHILQYTQSLVHQFVTLASVYVHYHTHAACVMLILWLIKSV